MNRIFAMILFCICILATFAGCDPAQIDNTPPAFSHSGNDTSGTHDFSDTEMSDTDTSPSNETSQDTDIPTPPDNNEEPLFTYNVYQISPDARSYYSEREYALYCKAVDSILSHNGVVEGFESEDEFMKIWSFLLSEFVPVRSIIQTYAVSNEPFSYKNGTATLKFIADEATCKENYEVFEDRMNEALSLIKEDDNDWERIAKLYLYVSDHMVYGSCYTTYGVNADLHNAIMYKIGECAEYALYLNLLANQIGFETIVGRSLGKNGFEGADHAWSMIKVEGQWYHFDACWQAPLLKDNMDYFAFSTQDRYDSLANNNAWGYVGEPEMFNQHYYTNERTELPYCENGMNGDTRAQLYLPVIDEYLKGLANEIPEDMIESYIDSALAEIRDAVADGATVGIVFEIKNGTMNAAVQDLILTYSPQDLQDYPELEYGADRCMLTSVVLKHIDQSDLKSMLYFIINEDIVIDQSVKLIVL